MSAGWNAHFAGIIKQFVFDAGLFVVLFTATLLWARGPRLRFFRPLILLLCLLFGCFCVRGIPRCLAERFLNRAEALTALAQQNQCLGRSQVLVVLGGGTLTDDHLASASYLRIFETARLLRDRALAGIGTTVVLSGGFTRPTQGKSEAFVMGRHLVALLGEHASFHRIVLEEKSQNTFENAVLTLPVLETRGLPPRVALVTSAVHMARAHATFVRQGYEVCPVSVPSPEFSHLKWISFGNAERTVQVLNEYLGWLGYVLRGWI